RRRGTGGPAELQAEADAGGRARAAARRVRELRGARAPRRLLGSGGRRGLRGLRGRVVPPRRGGARLHGRRAGTTAGGGPAGGRAGALAGGKGDRRDTRAPCPCASDARFSGGVVSGL